MHVSAMVRTIVCDISITREVVENSVLILHDQSRMSQISSGCLKCGGKPPHSKTA